MNEQFLNPVGQPLGQYPQRYVVPLPRETHLDVVRRQIEAIQSIALPIGHWLLAVNANNDPKDPEAFKRNPMTGEHIVAAELTFMMANEALQKILLDPKLLDFEEQETMEKATVAVLEENKKLAETHRKTVEWANSPAARFQPDLVRLNQLFGWAAVLGDVANPQGMICGVGPNPQAALEHFNVVFTGQASEPVQFYALAREQALKLNQGERMPATFDSEKDKRDNSI
jgi:hypothetical protein